jgi:hypothetical protein
MMVRNKGRSALCAWPLAASSHLSLSVAETPSLCEYLGRNVGICYLLIARVAVALKEQLNSALLILKNSYVLLIFR